jgi:hypothetical protein
MEPVASGERLENAQTSQALNWLEFFQRETLAALRAATAVSLPSRK